MEFNLRSFKIKGRKSPEMKVKLMRADFSGSASLKQECDKFVIDIDKENLLPEEMLVPDEKCCIYKVPKRLRVLKKDAYTPQLISIGPFHHGKKRLRDMQKQKIRYYNRFVKRINESDHEKLKSYVKHKEQGIRNCYAEESELSSKDFTGMILYDAIFILELFLRNDCHRYGSDFLLDQLWQKEALELDLQLLENQLPYFVLDELFKIAFGRPTGVVCLISLCCKFFGYDKCPDMLPALPDSRIRFKHFVDLRRNCMVEFLPTEVREDRKRDLPSAVKLDESGVKFEAMKGSESDAPRGLLDVKFQPRKRSKCIRWFKGKTSDSLQIPRIVIEDYTECLIRNMMALEQCHYPSETHLCNYIDLIDSLINTTKDVDLLVEKGIISNRVGDHKTISTMFNGLCLQIKLSDSCYQGIRNDLKTFHDRWWNRTKANLISVYFKDVWRGTATVAATLLLVLTVLQTMQRLWGGWTPHK